MMNYTERINRAIDFIGKNLDDDLTLGRVSGVACFSKYHFIAYLQLIQAYPCSTI